MLNRIKEFLRLEAASGIILVAAAVLAMIMANSPLAGLYQGILDIPVQIRVGALDINKPLLLWINDGLMGVFFFLIGLELKREVLEGELRDIRRVALPAFGAVGGMVLPGLIYAVINWGDATNLRGWAIPTATDIAFVMGILALLGRRVPLALKVFLVSLAIFDDVGAIVIIAAFYTDNLSFSMLAFSAVCVLILLLLNRSNVVETAPYILVGIVMWIAILKSGVHATLAGVLLAMFIPIRDHRAPNHSPLKDLEHNLHGTVAYAILPIFAFANAGVSLQGAGLDFLLHPVPLGVAAGLILGKQFGVLLFCWLGMVLGLARLPAGVGWRALYGGALLCGVGFTMSLFIGSLAFGEAAHTDFDERLGIIIGSLVCGIAGYLWLRLLPEQSEDEGETQQAT